MYMTYVVLKDVEKRLDTAWVPRPVGAHVSGIYPKFVKKYCNVADIIISAFKEYNQYIKEGHFPGEEHVYHVIGDIEPFNEMFKRLDES